MGTVTKYPFKGSSCLHSLDGRKPPTGINIGLWTQPDKLSKEFEAM